MPSSLQISSGEFDFRKRRHVRITCWSVERRTRKEQTTTCFASWRDRACHTLRRCLVLPFYEEDRMFKWLLHRAITGFERQWDYDASYLHDIIDADPRAAWMFQRATGL